ncbi:MAG: tetratricopeptide repeat protein [Heteroscytonema crispum UTEX LB 1556]
MIVIFVIALLLCISQPFWLSFPMIFGSFVVVGQTNDERKVEAESLLQQGIQQHNKNQYEAALQSFQQAFVIAKEIKNRKLQSDIIGLISSSQRQNDSRIAKIYELIDKSFVMNANSQFKSAIELNQQALKISQEIKEPISKAIALNHIGIGNVFLGNYDKGIDYIEQSLSLARKNSDPLIENQALGNLGIAYRRKGDYLKAIDYLQQQLAIAREIEDHIGELKVLANLGNMYKNQEDCEQAISHYEQSLAIAKEIPDRQSEGMAIGSI